MHIGLLPWSGPHFYYLSVYHPQGYLSQCNHPILSSFAFNSQILYLFICGLSFLCVCCHTLCIKLPGNLQALLMEMHISNWRKLQPEHILWNHVE